MKLAKIENEKKKHRLFNQYWCAGKCFVRHFNLDRAKRQGQDGEIRFTPRPEKNPDLSHNPFHPICHHPSKLIEFLPSVAIR